MIRGTGQVVFNSAQDDDGWGPDLKHITRHWQFTRVERERDEEIQQTRTTDQKSHTVCRLDSRDYLACAS